MVTMTQFIEDCYESKNLNYKYKWAWYKVKSRRSVGDMSYLYDKYRPVDELDFYNKYIEDGATSTETDITHRGRSLEELSDITDKYMAISHSTDREEAFNNLIYHIIIETYIGHKREEYLMCYLRKIGCKVKKSDPDTDAINAIDLICHHNGKKFFVQVKPFTYFIGNKSCDLIHDRKEAYRKRKMSQEEYGCNTLFAVYKGNQWMSEGNGRVLYDFEEMMDKDGKVGYFDKKFRDLS